MKRLGFGALLSFLLVGSLAAQNGSKRVDLKEITDGQFRQVTNIGEMRSMPAARCSETKPSGSLRQTLLHRPNR